MRKTTLSLGMKFITGYLFVQGLIMAVFCFIVLIDYPWIKNIVAKNTLLSQLFFYVNIPKTILYTVLRIRLCVAILQMMLAFIVHYKKPWILNMLRTVMLLFVAASVLNPFQTITTIAFTFIFHSILLWFFIGYKQEHLFKFGWYPESSSGNYINELENTSLPQKSGGVRFIGFTQFIFGLLLLKFFQTNFSLSGIPFSFHLKNGFAFQMMFSKVLLLSVSSGLTIMGILIFQFYPLSRFITVLFYIIFLFLVLIALIFIDFSVISNSGVIFSASVLIPSMWSLFSLFFLLNPNVKEQFSFGLSKKFWHKLFYTVFFIGLFMAFFWGVNFVVKQNPKIFEKTQDIAAMKNDYKFRHFSMIIDWKDWVNTFLSIDQGDRVVREKKWRLLSEKIFLNYKAKEYEKATKAGLDALAIGLEIFDPLDPKMTVTYNNLGMLYFALKRFDDSEKFLMKALELNEKNFGPNHPRVATDYINLARLYRQMKEYFKAEHYYKKALGIYKIAYGVNSPYVRMVKENFINLHKEKLFFESQKIINSTK